MQSKSAAVILAAGEGKRLRPFTLAEAKCMARVNGVRIIDKALEGLAAAGCGAATIVIGYLGDRVRSTLGDSRHGLRLRYVCNPDYASTNSMYSLLLGLQALEQPCWIIEGDVFFEPSVLTLAAGHDIDWFVDFDCRAVDGSYVGVSDGMAASARIVRDLSKIKADEAKSCGILHVTEAGRATLVSWLEASVADGKSNEYYDLILRERIEAGAAVGIVDVRGRRWFEIDSQIDLAAAERLFAPQPPKG